MNEASDATRLFLVTPPRPDPAAFPARLREALSAGDVAAVLIATDAATGQAEALAMSLVPLVQEAGAAALVLDDTRLAGHAKADGVHVASGIGDIRLAAESFRSKKIVGAGNLTSRHTAMEAGEAGADYVFFGRAHGDTHDAPHPKALDLASWWAELMEVPAVAMAGRTLASVEAAAATGAAFVALHDAVWSHGAGPAEAVDFANLVLQRTRRHAA
jgi:thiamine-phosphate pyrophosphorylase